VGGAAGTDSDAQRLLVVDDDRLLAETLRAMIADVAEHALHRRVEVSVSGSARDATRRLAASESFDAILCDLSMPGTDGLAFYEDLRARAHPLASRFALVTGGSFSPAATAFLAKHPLPCLQKPFDDDQLAALLRRLLGD
jgi:CheY-like chemotaxis protein